MTESINRIKESWLFREPAMAAVLSTHPLVDAEIPCMFRSGRGRIEFNHQIVELTERLWKCDPRRPKHEKWPPQIEAALKTEVLRILLRHPYMRRPEGCSNTAATLASNKIIHSHYKCCALPPLLHYCLEEGMFYEWYACEIEDMLRHSEESRFFPSGKKTANKRGEGFLENDNLGKSGMNSYRESSPTNSSFSTTVPIQTPTGTQLKLPAQQRLDLESQSELWEEDALGQQRAAEVIGKIQGWGSLAGKMERVIKESLIAPHGIDDHLKRFKRSLGGSSIEYTRTRPSRRYGWSQMGTMHRERSRVLVAIDVSASIAEETRNKFYATARRLFQVGMGRADLATFDTELSPIVPLSRCRDNLKFVGEGGTNFQPIFDYVERSRAYTGVVVLTDGMAAPPEVKNTKVNVLWVCDTPQHLSRHYDWMSRIGTAVAMENP